MRNSPPIVILFNGPPGVGKSTIAKELAKKSRYGAFTDVDSLRHHIFGGVVSARNQKKDTNEFERQRLLAADNVSCMANNYVRYGFNYFISDLVKIPSVIKRYRNHFKDINFYHVILRADIEELEKRDASRTGLKLHGKEVIEKINKEMRELDYSDCVTIDTTNKSVQATVNLVLEKLGLNFKDGQFYSK